MKCPVCSTENSPGIITCIHCGSDLYTALLELVSTSQLDRNRVRTVLQHKTMPSSKPVVIYIRDVPEPMAIPRSGLVKFGRRDAAGDSHPLDIDLSPYQAELLGVSRLHAEIDTSTIPPTIRDLDSFNGTFINGQQLVTGAVYHLQSGDEIRLGRMVMRLFYDF